MPNGEKSWQHHLVLLLLLLVHDRLLIITQLPDEMIGSSRLGSLLKGTGFFKNLFLLQR